MKSLSFLCLQFDSCYLDCASEIQGYKYPAGMYSQGMCFFCFSISFLIFVTSDFSLIHK